MNVELEYRVRPVTRYVVTKYENPYANSEAAVGNTSSSVCGEFASEEVANSVAYALCKADHERLGWPIDDERISYPTSAIGGPAA